MLSLQSRIKRRPALRAHLGQNFVKVKENYIAQSVMQTIMCFCRETSIHGCRFIFEEIEDTGNSYIRRFRRLVSLTVWLTADVLGAVFAIFLMALIWTRFQNTPTMTTVETNNYPIWNVPFPGVTICNVNAVYKPNTKHIARELLIRGFPAETVEQYFQTLAALVNFEEVDSQFLKISQTLEDLNYTTERIMFELTHPCEKLLRHCTWSGQDTPCKNLFRIAKSAQGFCCSFNYKALRSQFEMFTRMIIERRPIKSRKRRLTLQSQVLSKAGNSFIAQSAFNAGYDFCKETNLHGCRFIVDSYEDTSNVYLRNTLRLLSSSIWTSAVVMGLGFAIYLMLLVWSRYQTTPTITTIETNNFPIWNVAFPGVTICNVNTVYKPNTVNVSQSLDKNGFSAASMQKFFQSLGNLVTFEEVDSEFVKIFRALEDLGYTTERLMFELAQPCELMLRQCVWLGKEVPCNTLFRLAKSGGGFCCSFNYKALRSSLEIKTKVDDYYQINTPVIRISGAGEDVGLKVLLDVEMEEYVSPKRFFYGAEVILHDPEDFPEKSLLTAFGQPGLEVSIAVTPSVVVTEKTVETLPVSLRFCRFSHEKQLQITKKYSFQSCITECRARTIIEKCGCLPFFYPEVNYRNQSSISRHCTLQDVKCLSDNKHMFASLEPPSDIGYVFNNTLIGMSCDCLPSCTEQSYNVETFISQRVNDVKIASTLNDTDITNFTLIKVYFKDLSCIKYRREIFMTWDDLLASFGGIFGLCLGGSVLSLVEIVYYATFKFYAKLLTNKTKLEKQRRQEQATRQFLLNFNRTHFSPNISKLSKSKEFLW